MSAIPNHATQQIRFLQVDTEGNLKNLSQPEREICYAYIPLWGKLLKCVYDATLNDYRLESCISNI